MVTLKEIREKISMLEHEKAELQAALEDLREKAEEKADSLEDEVAQLREETEELKKMLEVL
jgi:peptidoglycan hydrolase CwlO-like protein